MGHRQFGEVLSVVYQIDTVVNSGRCSVRERIGDAYKVCGIHTLSDFLNSEPAHGGSLVGWGKPTADWWAAEHESDDPSGHVLVDTGKAFNFDFYAGFFQNLAAYALIEGLV
jgi:hypothetical protein